MVIMNYYLLKLYWRLLILTCIISYCYHDININMPISSQIDNINCSASTMFDSISIVQLTKNKWYNIIATDCISYISFQQDYRYEEYDCERGLTSEGKYKILEDTIFMYEYGLASDLPGETQIVNRNIYTYVYQRDSLRFVSNKFIRDGIVTYTYIPSIPVYYKSRNILKP